MQFVGIIDFILVVFWQRFSAVIMRLRDPKTTALIFGSGKVRWQRLSWEMELKLVYLLTFLVLELLL